MKPATLIVFLLCLLSAPVLAAEFNLTSTSDFDSGSKGNNSGSYEIEKRTTDWYSYSHKTAILSKRLAEVEKVIAFYEAKAALEKNA